jgi:dienelactone hydrolase
VDGGALLRPGDARDAADARRGGPQASRPLSVTRRLAALILVLGAGGCLALDAGPDARLEAVWQSSRVWLPAAALPASLVNGARILDVDAALTAHPPASRLGVVLYAHGCAGPGDEPAQWASALGPAGFALIAPDAGAGPACGAGGVIYTRGDAALLARRADEVRYAREQIAYLSWVRAGDVFLLGFDHGGVVTAHWNGPAFAGYIVTGWTCTAPDVRGGLSIPVDRPVLAIRWEEDPLFADPAWNGNCGTWLRGRAGSRSILLEGRGHATAGSAEARAAVVRFLQLHTLR